MKPAGDGKDFSGPRRFILFGENAPLRSHYFLIWEESVLKKEAFLNELRNRLSGLPQSDIEDRISFFGEMIDGRIEDGMSEEEAVAGMESVDAIVAQIMSEIPLARLVRNKVKPEKGHSVWKVVLLICLFPIWFPLLIAVAAVLFSLLIAAWAVIISFYITAGSLVIASLGCVIATGAYFGIGRIVPGIGGFGAIFVCIGLSILFFLLSIAMTKGTVFLTRKMFIGLKTSFVGKEA